MPAPKKNKYYQLRSKDGKDQLFATPEALMAAAQEYFVWVDNNPWFKTEFKGSRAKRVQVPTKLPYTLAGLCNHLGVNKQYFSAFKERISVLGPEDKNVLNQVFLETIEFIEQIIYDQKFTGAAINAFNANIISRDLGLIDKKNIEVDMDKMNDEQLDLIINHWMKKDA